MLADKPFAEWTHDDYVRKLVELDVLSPKIAAALMVLCDRACAVAVNEALHRVAAPEGEGT